MSVLTLGIGQLTQLVVDDVSQQGLAGTSSSSSSYFGGMIQAIMLDDRTFDTQDMISENVVLAGLLVFSPFLVMMIMVPGHCS